MNARRPPSKRSRIERRLDILILGMFALLFTMCIIGASCFAVWTKNRMPNMWYLAPGPGQTAAAYNPQRPGLVWFLSFVTSFVLYGYLIPISLYVSLEMVKVIQSAVFINQDRGMYHPESDTPAKVTCSCSAWHAEQAASSTCSHRMSASMHSILACWSDQPHHQHIEACLSRLVFQAII